MLLNFVRSGHPIFRCTSALEKGQKRSKGWGKTTVHFTACEEKVQLLLKMVMSVNQLSLYGAIADMIQELPEDQRAPGRLVALDQIEEEIVTQLLIAEVQANEERQGYLCARLRAKIWKTTRRPEAIKIVFRSMFGFGRSWTIILCSSVTEWSEESIFMPRIHITSRWKRKLCKRVDRKRCTIRPCLGQKVCKTHGRHSVEVKVPSFFEDRTSFWMRIESGVEKCVREAMPIQEEERASGKPAAKARPILKPSSISN